MAPSILGCLNFQSLEPVVGCGNLFEKTVVFFVDNLLSPNGTCSSFSYWFIFVFFHRLVFFIRTVLMVEHPALRMNISSKPSIKENLFNVFIPTSGGGGVVYTTRPSTFRFHGCQTVWREFSIFSFNPSWPISLETFVGRSFGEHITPMDMLSHSLEIKSICVTFPSTSSPQQKAGSQYRYHPSLPSFTTKKKPRLRRRVVADIVLQNGLRSLLEMRWGSRCDLPSDLLPPKNSFLDTSP